MNGHYRLVEATLRRSAPTSTSRGSFVRDYLLDVEGERAPEYRTQIAQFRRANLATLEELKTLVDEGDQIVGLQAPRTSCSPRANGSTSRSSPGFPSTKGA